MNLNIHHFTIRKIYKYSYLFFFFVLSVFALHFLANVQTHSTSGNRELKLAREDADISRNKATIN